MKTCPVCQKSLEQHSLEDAKKCLSDAGYQPADELPKAMGLARSLGVRVAVRNYKGDTYLRFEGGEFKSSANPVLAVYREILPNVQMALPEVKEEKPSGFSLFGRKEVVEEEDDGSEIREETE